MPKQKQQLKSELRKDYIQDKYVIIAPKRNKRPHDLEVPQKVKSYDNPEESVFHPKNVKNIYNEISRNIMFFFIIHNKIEYLIQFT